MNDVKLVRGPVTVALSMDESEGGDKGKPSPEQWAAFIAAVLQALLALFGHQPPPPPPPPAPPPPQQKK